MPDAIPIPSGASIQPLESQPAGVPIPQGAEVKPLDTIGGKIWNRLNEPVKMGEVEKIPGLEPSRAQSLKESENILRGGLPGGEKEPSIFDPEVVARAAAKTLTDFYSPVQLALRFPAMKAAELGKAAQTAQKAGDVEKAARLIRVSSAMGLGATAAGIPLTAKQVRDTIADWNQMTPAERAAAVGGDIGSAILTGIGLHQGMGGGLSTKQTEPLSKEAGVLKIGSGSELAPQSKRVVIRDLRDHEGNSLGRLSAPYDGTPENAREVAQQLAAQAYSEYPEHSNIQSRTVALNEEGRGKWAVSPNFKYVSEAGTKDARYILGDISAQSPSKEAGVLKIGGEPEGHSNFQADAQKLGIEFRGIQEGGEGHPGLAMYQDPESGTSIGVKLDEYSPEKLQERLTAARERMAPKQAIEKGTEKLAGKLPEMRDNYLKDLSTYSNVLYHETSPEKALELVPLGMTTRPDDLYFANTPELATGQHGNTGVKLEFDSKGIQGQVNLSKPMARAIYEQGHAEFLSKFNEQPVLFKNLRSITFDKTVKAPKWVQSRFKTLILPNLEKQGWTRSETPDSVRYERPESSTK